VAAIYILKVAVDYGIAVIKPFDGKFYFERITQQTACTEKESNQPASDNHILAASMIGG
jgi:hypothetical protein